MGILPWKITSLPLKLYSPNLIQKMMRTMRQKMRRITMMETIVVLAVRMPKTKTIMHHVVLPNLVVWKNMSVEY